MTESTTPTSGNAYHAQFGEDRILDQFFGDQPRFFVEVGAADGVSISNTLFFERKGWTGILVEAHPETAKACERNRPGSTVVACAVVAPEDAGTASFTLIDGNDHYSALSVDDTLKADIARWTNNASVRTVSVPARTLDSILEESAPDEIAFLTLDVEGFEPQVLEGFSFARWKPRFLIIERNKAFRKVFSLCHANGYRYFRTTGVNDWFVPESTSRMPAGVYKLWFAIRLMARLRVGEEASRLRSQASRVKKALGWKH